VSEVVAYAMSNCPIPTIQFNIPMSIWQQRCPLLSRNLEVSSSGWSPVGSGVDCLLIGGFVIASMRRIASVIYFLQPIAL